jgi:hypothetical protein
MARLRFGEVWETEAVAQQAGYSSDLEEERE